MDSFRQLWTHLSVGWWGGGPTDLAGLTDRACGPTFPTLGRIIYWGLYAIPPHRHRATTHHAGTSQEKCGKRKKLEHET